jgi:hypothetical protein
VSSGVCRLTATWITKASGRGSDRQGEHVRADESQRGLTGLEKKVVPPKQHSFRIFGEVWVVVLLSRVRHGHMVHQVEQLVRPADSPGSAGYTRDEATLRAPATG